MKITKDMIEFVFERQHTQLRNASVFHFNFFGLLCEFDFGETLKSKIIALSKCQISKNLCLNILNA